MEEPEEDIVMIKLKRKTRETLKELGRKGDTYDDVINTLFNAQTRREDQ